MIEFKRNKDTGELEAYKNGKKVGSVGTMGDEVKDNSVAKESNLNKYPRKKT